MDEYVIPALVLIFPAGLIGAYLSGVGATHERAVPRAWYALLLVGALLLPLVVLVHLDGSRPVSILDDVVPLWTLFHFLSAGALGVLALALASARSSGTPRRRTTSAATRIMAALMVPTLVWPALFWTWIPLLGGIYWVRSINRHADLRTTWGRRISASWLMAAGIQFAFVLAHLYVFLLMQDPMVLGQSGTSLLVGGGVLVAALIGGLRVLVPDAPEGPLRISVLVGLVSLVHVGFVLWPMQVGVPTPRWVDLEGRSGYPLSYSWEAPCVRLLGEKPSSRCQYAPYALPPQLPSAMGVGLELVVDGVYELGQWHSYRYSDRKVTFAEGGAVVDGTFVPQGALHRTLLGDQQSALTVVAAPAWTIQDYISMCASTGAQPKCTLIAP